MGCEKVRVYKTVCESIRASKMSGMSGEQRETYSKFPLVKPSASSFNNNTLYSVVVPRE